MKFKEQLGLKIYFSLFYFDGHYLIAILIATGS